MRTRYAWRGLAGLVLVAATACGSGAPSPAPHTLPTTATTAPPATTTSTTASVAPTTSKPATTATTTVRPPAATVVSRGDPSRRLIALTFDAGSDTGDTAAILDLLESGGIRATFGITGVWAHANPALVARMARDGDQIVNHTWDHQSFTGRSTATAPLARAQRLAELDRADAEIASITGRSTKPWFRPPYGDRDASVDADVGLDGYRFELMWTVDSLGWQGLPADQVVARVLGAAAPGAIVLCHVGSASTDYQALPAIVSGLRAMGYGFATAADVAGG